MGAWGMYPERRRGEWSIRSQGWKVVAVVAVTVCLRRSSSRWGASLLLPGGWKASHDEKSVAAQRDGEIDFSDVPVFAIGSVPEDVANDPGQWAGRPFILRGSQHLFDAQDGLHRDRVMKVARDSDVNISFGYSWTIAARGGSGHQQAPLHEYLDTVMRTDWYDGDVCLEPPYAFDRNAQQLEAAGLQLPGKSLIPDFVRNWHLPDMEEKLVMIGGPKSAVGWHRHGPAMQGTVYGSKRWFLYPAGRYPPGDGPGGGFSITDWLRLIYPSLRRQDKPIELIQHAGDILYVPDGWYHAVINLADSVAVSLQSRECAVELQETFKRVSLRYVQQLHEEDPEGLKEIEQAAKQHIHEHPENDLHARKVLFYVLSQTDPAKAVDVLLEVAKRDPFHVPSQFELATWLVDRAISGDEFAIDAFKRAMSIWRPYLELNTRNLKALWILSKYEKLAGDAESAAQYHQRLVELNDRGIDR